MKIAIIGGGAAGMMCAATLLEHHLKAGNSKEVQVVLFEKNSVLGKKVSLSGGGRCNVTTGLTDHKTILTKYTRGAEFFKPILGKFGPKKVCDWFERHGVPLKCEEDLRIFPVSDSGEDVIGAFQSIFSQAGKALEIRYRTSVIDASRKQSGFQITFKDSSPGAVEQTEIFDVLVLTTGGNAYAHTGSTGDGYALAARLWHRTTPLGPSLSSFETEESWPKELSGIAFPRATLVDENGKFRCDGAILLTHFWISGPGAFSFSSLIAFETLSKEHPLKIRCIPVCGWTVQDWDRYIEQACRENSSKLVASILSEVLPKRCIHQIFSEHILSQKGAILSRSDRKTIALLLGEWIPLTLVSRRAGDEFVTAGGIDLSQINGQGESNDVPNMFFAGEILNIDGVTGGFNLQVAWSTGYVVGTTIGQRMEEDREY